MPPLNSRSPRLARVCAAVDLSQVNRYRSHTVRRCSQSSSALYPDASFSLHPTEAMMCEQRHRNTFNGHHEASCGRCDGRCRHASFDLSFGLVIVPVDYFRDDVVRGLPVMAHHTTFGAVLVTTSNIFLDALSHGSFTRSASIEHHPSWRQFPSALAPPPTFLLQRRNTDPQRKAAEASP